MFECALIYGMSSEEFWFGNPQDYFVYQDAFCRKERNRHDEQDILAWSYARYNLLSFRQVMAESLSKTKRKLFPEKPFSLQEQKDNMLEKMKRVMDRVNASKSRKK